GVIKRRREWQTSGAAPLLAIPDALPDGFIGSLPFEMTSAQRRAIDTILADIRLDVPMSRLLEGDVGSGKTVVAATALLAAVASGYQGASMAPTPLPRTLALTVYGDLDITVLDEMPPGRPETKTYRVPPRQRESAYKFVRDKVAEGRQAYVICPLVEESETIQTKAAVQEYER